MANAGTLISAILLLFKQQWRNSINRFAEAMTIFAVVCAGMFPLIHVGRPWLGYWLFPYPNTMNVWPQFRSPLLWDVFAVSTYATISVVFRVRRHDSRFWNLALHRAKSKFAQYAYGILCLGWRGSVRHWMRYETASLLLAVWPLPWCCRYTPSSASISPWPFCRARGIPQFSRLSFAAGAIILVSPWSSRWLFRSASSTTWEGLITIRHIDKMATTLATGLIVAYGYSMEVFEAWYSASHWEYFMMWNRMFGPMGWSYWVLITCNIALPQLLWLRSTRVSPGKMFIMSLIVNTGMWFERFVIVVTSLYRDFLPSSWGTYPATRWHGDATFVGTLGLFTALFFLFVRFLPMIPMSEIRMMLPQAKVTEPEAMEAGD